MVGILKKKWGMVFCGGKRKKRNTFFYHSGSGDFDIRPIFIQVVMAIFDIRTIFMNCPPPSLSMRCFFVCVCIFLGAIIEYVSHLSFL